jgi:hypothetical protein
MKNLAFTAIAAACLYGCGTPPPTSVPASSPAAAPVPTPAPPAAPATAASAPQRATGLPHYRCDQGVEFTVRFSDDTAVVDAGPRGNDVLLRDAGGATPQQTVYSNPRMRAEFGLGVTGREALLRYAQPPLSVHCKQD